ncbi:hypothetical protein BD410DRAFT_900568 [Rickenella mellea]|uniref:Uncharacterized protein n=1 Tax=Rickenella mellea TaxID=50990 RepID=A0A4Y7PWF1_9AGAM|nr:hypothetical protein BD410DRAFT_900568 [Rickenella mellea]
MSFSAMASSPRRIARLPKRKAPTGAFAASQAAMLPPPVHIPAEILVVIFSWLQAIVKSDASKSIAAWQTGININSWIFVTHVCKDWRQAALEYGSLWSNINSLQPLGLIMSSLERSKNVPLDVRIAGTSNEIAEILLENLPRIRDLTYALTGASPADAHGYLEQLWAQPAPLLESVSVLSTNPATSPIPILQGPHPVLKRVNLVAFPVPWDSLKLDGLTELGIMYLPPEYQPTVSQIHTILLACPNLNALGLTFAPPSATNDTLDADAQLIHLPHLSNARIEMSAQMWAPLLQQLVLSHEFKWIIEIPYCPSRLKDRLIPIGDLSATGQALVVTLSVNGLDIYQECMSDPGPEGTKQKIGLVWPQVGPNESIQVAFDNIVELVKNTSWANATSLRINFAGFSVEEGTPIMWKTLFEVFSKLNRLTISLHILNMADPEFGLAQALMIPQKLEDGTMSFLLPDLRILHVRNGRLMHYGIQARAFAKCFQARQNIAPLQEMVLINSSSIPRAVLQSLKECVKVVEERDEDPTDSEMEHLEPTEKQRQGGASGGDDGNSDDWESDNGEGESD